MTSLSAKGLAITTTVWGGGKQRRKQQIPAGQGTPRDQSPCEGWEAHIPGGREFCIVVWERHGEGENGGQVMAAPCKPF